MRGLLHADQSGHESHLPSTGAAQSEEREVSQHETLVRALDSLEDYRERHLVPPYFLNALADLRTLIAKPDEYTAFLESEAAKTTTGRCRNCNAALRPLHCCVCEGCDGCRERLQDPAPALYAALKKIYFDNEVACGCECDVDTCCNRAGEPCAKCDSRAALALVDGTEKED